MTRSSWNDRDPGTAHDLDAAIDDAVRALTSVDADSSFRARVLDRIARRRESRVPDLRLMLGLSACAAIVLAVVLTRPSGPAAPALNSRTTASRGSNTAPSPVSAPAPAALTPSTAPLEPGPGTMRRARRREPVQIDVPDGVPPDAIVAAVAEPTTTVEIVPLTELAPIAITPLEPAPIMSPDIAIAPLTPMADLGVAPLSPPTERE